MNVYKWIALAVAKPPLHCHQQLVIQKSTFWQIWPKFHFIFPTLLQIISCTRPPQCVPARPAHQAHDFKLELEQQCRVIAIPNHFHTWSNRSKQFVHTWPNCTITFIFLAKKRPIVKNLGVLNICIDAFSGIVHSKSKHSLGSLKLDQHCSPPPTPTPLCLT